MTPQPKVDGGQPATFTVTVPNNEAGANVIDSILDTHYPPEPPPKLAGSAIPPTPARIRGFAGPHPLARLSLKERKKLLAQHLAAKRKS